ncbi:MAG: hypothetical protein ACK5CE_22890 [Actinomycetes bacterium]
MLGLLERVYAAEPDVLQSYGLTMPSTTRNGRPPARLIHVPSSWGSAHWVVGDDNTVDGSFLNVVSMRRRDVERIAQIVPGSASVCSILGLVPPLSDTERFWIAPWEIHVGESVVEMSLNLPCQLLKAPLMSYPTVDTAARMVSPAGMEAEMERRVSTRRLPWSSVALIEALRSLGVIQGRVRWFSDVREVDEIDVFGSGTELVELLTARDDPHMISGLVDATRMPFYLW